MSELVGAERYERTETRKTYRNGYRVRPWETRLGSIELKIPKLRKGSYFPSLLERRRRAEKALVAVIQEAYVHGVSTRKVDELVRALGLDGVSKSEVSRLCAELDERMERFRNRPLDAEYPYLWLDAKAIKVRQDGRVVNMAAVVAVGVKASGEREVLGFDVGAAETYEFWQAFLRSLVARGLRGVRLAISDAHEGLKRAIAEVLTGASWQRCRVHTIRTQLHNGRGRIGSARGWAAKRDDMTDLQCILAYDDAFDNQLQDRLFVLKGGLLQPHLDALTEGAQVGVHLLGPRPLLA